MLMKFMKAKTTSSLLKMAYFVYFFFVKRWRYPSCSIHTNFVMPNVKLGKGVVLRNKVKIQRSIIIGDYTFINEYSMVDPGTKSIGKYCSISHNVKIGVGSHPQHHVSTSAVFYSKSRGYINSDLYNQNDCKRKTEIGHDVLLGASSIIIAGVMVGHGAIVGAGSIVTHDVPPYAIVAGVPAKVLGYRFPEEVIEELIESKWWDLEVDKLICLRELMSCPEAFLAKIKLDKYE